MKLNKSHRELLAHRLDADVIPGVLDDSPDLQITFAEAEAAQANIKRMVGTSVLPESGLSRAEIEVLVDCLDGCTYFGNADDAVATGELNRTTLARRLEAASELEAFVSRLAGRRVDCTRN